jgi:transcriptional regulator with XRE-family HTH domain
MEQAQLVRLLMRRVDGSTQRQVAEDMGVSQAYLSDVLLRKRAPGPKILHALGLQQRIVYSKIGEEMS